MGRTSKADLEKRKEIFLKALEKSLGVVREACKVAGINRRSFYDYKKADPKFAQRVDDIDEIAIDFAESQLFQNIRDGKEASLIFFLKHKGKKRGYDEASVSIEIQTPKKLSWGKRKAMKVLNGTP